MYADYEFYVNSYAGEALGKDYVSVKKWLTRASAYLDILTFHRLSKHHPREKSAQFAVKMACCAVAEALQKIDEQEAAGKASMNESIGAYVGPITSVRSGNESISYGTASTVYGKAAASMKARQALLYSVAAQYLSGVADRTGRNLLYAGV